MRWAAGGLLVVFFVFSSLLGWMTQPWWPVWVGQQQGHTTIDTTVGSPNTGSLPPLVFPTMAPAVPVPAPVTFGSRVATVIVTAMSYLGTRYQWGGCTVHGVDCSCLVRNAYLSVGVSLPRTTTEQIRFATPISASQAVPGDLVFFDNTCTGCGANPTHVGLVLGEGRMIDAGDPVRIEPIYGGHNARYGRIP